MEEEGRILAYTELDGFDRKGFQEWFEKKDLGPMIRSIVFNELQEENWNDTWESAYDAVEIGSECYIRAPFHPEKTGFRHNLVIVPKMSFGTGHHATTRLMVEMMLKMDFSNRNVLDMGCGTGILAILAEKLGAAAVLAVDNYPRACENSIKNVGLNKCSTVEVLLGEIAELGKRTFDIILANINLNVLTAIIPDLSARLNKGGYICLSGFYISDLYKVHSPCTASLEMIEKTSLEHWTVAVYRKAR